ncbi:MAG: hypothetical protein KGL39_32115 [Patescibacteria group bacterium]|nr:hypothetical protein [Patescibacteria group bacterium]
MLLGIIGLAFGILGFTFGMRSYYELWKWAKQCQNARIVIGYKRKVKRDAPILEYLLWTNLLDRDRDANGRVMYSLGGTTIALIKGFDMPMGWRLFLRETLFRHTRQMLKQVKPTGTTASAPKVREGYWKGTDNTPGKVTA